MKDPNPINLKTSAEVEAWGCSAEARDADGHMTAFVHWNDSLTTNENLKELGVFIADYETDREVNVFVRTVAAKIA